MQDKPMSSIIMNSILRGWLIEAELTLMAA
jgi:hypothetical protein